MIDLSEVEVVDDHVHPFRLHEVLSRDPDGFEARLSMMGTCFASFSGSDPALWASIREQAGSAVFTLAARRWLAGRLGCEATPAAVAAARHEALQAGGVAYVHDLVADQRIVGLITDEGYPQPRIGPEEFEEETGTTVHRVVRIEPMLDRLVAEGAGSFGELEDGLDAELDRVAADPRTVAYKSIIAYRTGLDVVAPPGPDVAAAFDRWRADGFRESREHSKPVRDHALHRALDAAKRHDLVMHIHTGDGDPDVVLDHARPADLFPLLRARLNQPIVLIHGGHPWSHEAGYIASILPNVFVDLSVLVPWASSAVDHLLTVLLGMVPGSKLLYASDEASEPEVLWIAAKLARASLQRVLSDAVDRDYLTEAQGATIGAGILGANARRLHGLGG